MTNKIGDAPVPVYLLLCYFLRLSVAVRKVLSFPVSGDTAIRAMWFFVHGDALQLPPKRSTLPTE